MTVKARHYYLDVAKFIAIDLIGDVVYFPVWWYSQGLLKVLSWYKSYLEYYNDLFALTILLRSLFKPMFGQRDLAGRLISLLVRFVYLLFLFLGLLVWALILLFFVLLYLALPVIIVYHILYQLSLINNYLL